MAEAAVVEEVKSTRKKLSKDLTEHPLVKITALGGNKGEVAFDFTTLPKDIQGKLGPFGLGHKLGDAAAGRRGVEAEDAIARVWEGLMGGDWSVRAPAAPRVSLKEVGEKYGELSTKEQAAAKSLLTALGIKIPGLTDED